MMIYATIVYMLIYATIATTRQIPCNLNVHATDPLHWVYIYIQIYLINSTPIQAYKRLFFVVFTH